MSDKAAARAKAEEGGGNAVDLAQLPDYLGYQIRQAQTAVFRDFARMMADIGVVPGEFSLLTTVNANPGINQNALVQAYQLDKSTLSLAMNKLVKRGLIRRTPDERDRRYFSLWLTDEGLDLLARATERVENQERVMDGVLRPGERKAMLDMLRRISRAFDA